MLYSATGVVVLAHLMTTTHRTGDLARRSAGLAVIAAAGLVAAVGVAVAQPGLLRLVGAASGTVFLLLFLAKWSEAYDLRRREQTEVDLIRRLAAGLPEQWYVLADLELEPSWLEPVRIWAVVVGPGGVAVVQPCAEEGDLTPYGHIWMVGRGRRVRAIASPAAAACTAAEALSEVIGSEVIPVVPVVALTNLDSVFHKAETGALVVGAPHLAEGLQRRLGVGQRIWDSLHLAAFLSHYHH